MKFYRGFSEISLGPKRGPEPQKCNKDNFADKELKRI
jgi:hypothetical protein